MLDQGNKNVSYKRRLYQLLSSRLRMVGKEPSLIELIDDPLRRVIWPMSRQSLQVGDRLTLIRPTLAEGEPILATLWNVGASGEKHDGPGT